jgi:hypothetical protein
MFSSFNFENFINKAATAKSAMYTIVNLRRKRGREKVIPSPASGGRLGIVTVTMIVFILFMINASGLKSVCVRASDGGGGGASLYSFFFF